MTQMHPDQILTSPELVRRLLASQYPALANEPIAAEPMHGTDNDTFRVGENHAVRLPIIGWAMGQQEHIRPWLPWLRDRLSTPVAVPIFYGNPDAGYPHTWTIYPWLPGETQDFGLDDPQAARDIADFLMEVRALPTEGAPAAGRSPHALDANVRECLAQLTEADHRDQLSKIWNRMMQTPPWSGDGAVWMHGDVAPGNLLFVDGRFSAAIDWSGLGVGDPASDLQVAWNLFSPAARQEFREALDVDDIMWSRARARAFAQAAFQLPYYRETHLDLAGQAQYVFGQILDEWSGTQ